MPRNVSASERSWSSNSRARCVGVVRLFFHQGARRHQQADLDVLLGNAVVHVGQRFVDDALRRHVVEAATRLRHYRAHALGIQAFSAAVLGNDVNRWLLGVGFHSRRVGSADVGTFLPIQHVVARHLVLARAHQRQLCLILDLFDMDGAAGRQAPFERAGDLRRQFRHQVADA